MLFSIFSQNLQMFIALLAWSKYAFISHQLMCIYYLTLSYYLYYCLTLILLTTFPTSPETLHNANSLRNRCNTSNKSAAGPERSVDRSARWISNTAAAAVVPITISIWAPYATLLTIFPVRSINAFLCALTAKSSINDDDGWKVETDISTQISYLNSIIMVWTFFSRVYTSLVVCKTKLCGMVQIIIFKNFSRFLNKILYV